VLNHSVVFVKGIEVLADIQGGALSLIEADPVNLPAMRVERQKEHAQRAEQNGVQNHQIQLMPKGEPSRLSVYARCCPCIHCHCLRSYSGTVEKSITRLAVNGKEKR
jgi:DNA-binding Xre family transcriptional regulator